jgi:hypothetical protein
LPQLRGLRANGRQLPIVPPDDYLRGWAAVLADARKDQACGRCVIIVSPATPSTRCAAVCREVLDLQAIRRIPHARTTS